LFFISFFLLFFGHCDYWGNFFLGKYNKNNYYIGITNKRSRVNDCAILHWFSWTLNQNKLCLHKCLIRDFGIFHHVMFRKMECRGMSWMFTTWFWLMLQNAKGRGFTLRKWGRRFFSYMRNDSFGHFLTTQVKTYI